MPDNGVDRLDANCMMLIAIGESLKKLGRFTFDINTEIIFDLCRNKISPLKKTFESILKDMNSPS